ncbi:WD40-repeat-containing domain protein [Fomitopsis serialis]|uniref:WD40-repeat-containing domain protein n=1 Tax=Fomitopsis serialis TaxID=139415 RepID=UPI0020083727|nr:WD40-repeat-containing domain protein [Neoantrodia serialis]KAH9922431.1 WD40-repeat-containing domain protein [Neoantrodia serialis]
MPAVMAAHPASTIYMPIVSPPTPAPSPRLSAFEPLSISASIEDPACHARREFASLAPALRFQYLAGLLADCTPAELLFISTTITPLLRRDFLKDLPAELAFHVLSFIDDPKTLARASRVSRTWHQLLDDQWLWRRMCDIHGYPFPEGEDGEGSRSDETVTDEDLDAISNISVSAPTVSTLSMQEIPPPPPPPRFSYRKHFRYEYTTTSNWVHGGKLLRMHRMPLLPSSRQIPPQNPPADHQGGQGTQPSSAIPTSVAIDDNWVVVGLANSRIHVFSARTGVLSRTLVGHESGVWAVSLVRGSDGSKSASSTRHDREAENEEDRSDIDEMDMDFDEESLDPADYDPLMPPTLRHALGLDLGANSGAKQQRRRSASDVFSRAGAPKSGRPRTSGGQRARPAAFGKPSEPSGASDGWGQPHALVVSGGCDKDLRVWDVKSGYCIYVLSGHTSTIRCLKVLHGRPLAVTGSRDRTVRVWDIQRGRLLRTLEGHEQSVRCLDVCDRRVVSGSYDCTCRVWDIETGACLHVLRGHFHQIYSVAFDGVRIASGGLDTTVRVWDAATGACLALLQGHTALVCQLQLSPTMLATGGSDGRVIVFSLDKSFTTLQRLSAHDSSVTGLQLDERFLVTSGNDGRVRLFRFDRARGLGKCEYVRELTEPTESVWKVAFTRETCAIMSKRGGKTVMEMWSFRPEDAGLVSES